MPATELLCEVIGINTKQLSKEEIFIIEAELFVRTHEELKGFFKNKYNEYFQLMKFNAEMENEMLEANFLCFVVKDILLTSEYSLAGIACYTHTTEDVICDVVAGINTAPSLPLSRKLIDLHRSVRPHLYQETMKKVMAEYVGKVA